MLLAKEWKQVWDEMKKIANPSIDDLKRLIEEYKSRSTCHLTLVKG